MVYIYHIFINHTIPGLVSVIHPPSCMFLNFSLLSSAVVRCHPLSSAVVCCHPLSSAVVRCRLLSSTVVRCRPLLSAVVRCHPLSSAVVRCRPLSSTVVGCRSLSTCNVVLHITWRSTEPSLRAPGYGFKPACSLNKAWNNIRLGVWLGRHIC